MIGKVDPAQVPLESVDDPVEHESRHETARDGPGKYLPLTRREFLSDSAAIGVSAAIGAALAADPRDSQALTISGSEITITLQINGTPVVMTIEPRVTLLDAIRNHAGLTGTKMGCDHGQCGACTVHVDGRRLCSCLTLAAMHQGQQITTIEGLATGDSLHPVQAAFMRYDGLQCGFCTPGQIMSAVSLVEEGRAHSDFEIKEQMSGNICRCAAYPNIVAAIREVLEGKNSASF